MQIEPTPVHDAPFAGPGAWLRSSFPDADAWTYHLRPETIRELETRAPLASFQEDARRLRADLLGGRGFVLIKGLPIDRCTAEEATRMYCDIASTLGEMLPQNVKADRIYSVRDEGYNISRDYGATGVRFSKTTEKVHFHTDSAPALMGNTPDIVGLLALQIAKSGGASKIVSAQSLHNVLREERPDHLRRLYGSYYFDRRVEQRPGEPATLLAPVFRYADGLEIRYFRFYIPKGHELVGAPLEPADIEPLDYMESVTDREPLHFTFEMERGDMQFVNNRFVLHSRTAFEDHVEPERRRHLIRLWLKSS